MKILHHLSLLFISLLMACCSDTFNADSNTVTLDCNDFLEDITLSHESNRSVDYIIDCLVDVNNINITIEENVVVQFSEGSGLIINEDARLSIVSLVGDEPIVLQGQENEKGFWKGIVLNSNHDISRITNATISHAGDANDDRFKGAVNIQSHGWISHCTISDVEGHGIYVYDNAKIRDGMIDLDISNCSKNPASVPISEWDEFYVVQPPDAHLYGNVISTNCQPNKIEVREGSQEELKQFNGDIVDIGIPYEVKGDVVVLSSGRLHFYPGAEIEFHKNKRVFVYGSFQCKGESANPVTVRGLEDEQSYWGGIYLDRNNSGGASNIDYLYISNGGGGAFENANLTMRSGFYVVENCNIFDSGACGILHNENDATLTESSNTYANNSGGNICDY